MIVYPSVCCKLLQKAVKAMKFAALGIKKCFYLQNQKKKHKKRASILDLQRKFMNP